MLALGMAKPGRPSLPKATNLLSPSARIALLSAKRQQIIRPTFEHPKEFVLLSVRDLAKRLKTDPATVVRIVRGLRFSSYRKFQYYLHELSIANATSLDTMQSARTKKHSIPAQVRASLEQDAENLKALARGFDLRRVAALSRRFHTARRILLLGGDLAAHLVKILEYQLTFLGLPVASATLPGEVVHRVRHLGEKDLLIAVSYRRGLRQTVEGLRQARANGVYCVGITDSIVSPVGQFANECFLTSVETPSFSASYIAPVALFNTFVVACANYRRSKTLVWLRKVEQEQRHGFRWFES